jgi:hypothetical protein
MDNESISPRSMNEARPRVQRLPRRVPAADVRTIEIVKNTSVPKDFTPTDFVINCSS